MRNCRQFVALSWPAGGATAILVAVSAVTLVLLSHCPRAAQAQAETLPPSAAPPAAEIPVGDSFFVPGDQGPPISTSWYNPFVYFRESPWEASIELGINGAEGNSEAFNLRTGFDLDRHTDRYDWDIDLVYSKNESNQIETQHFAILDSNWDWKLASPRWTFFNKLQLMYDEFKNFDLRLVLNAGLGYLFVDTDITRLKSRFGAGASREFGGIDEDWVPEALFGLDFSRQFSKRQKFELTADYFPSWEDFSDYRLVTDASWQLMLDEASNMTLKLGVIDLYDSTPNGAKPNDINYSLMLLWSL